MNTAMTTAMPRVAILVEDAEMMPELEEILRSQYSSLLIVTDRAKLGEFDLPLIIVVESIRDAAEVRGLGLADGTRVLIISREGDSEMVAAAFDAGADDVLAYPFDREAVIGKIEKYLDAYRA